MKTNNRYIIISLSSWLWLVVSPNQVSSMEDVIPENTDLNIMLVVSFGQSGFNSSGVIPAADIALEDINKDPNMLPGYHLTYGRVRDSEVSQILNYLDRLLRTCSTKLSSLIFLPTCFAHSLMGRRETQCIAASVTHINNF